MEKAIDLCVKLNEYEMSEKPIRNPIGDVIMNWDSYADFINDKCMTSERVPFRGSNLVIVYSNEDDSWEIEAI